MPNADYQRHSFLGGEVSPSLYERADMDKFGKWFSKAENIRFRETGAFRNRAGFAKVANTKNNLAGEVIKLLSFEFNDEESFLVELGPNYARFFKNGVPVKVNNAPYEIETPFTSFTDDDLKYAQAGDTIFITHPTYGIYELARLQVDGTSWEIKKFDADILPMGEENTNKNSTISAAAFTQEVKTVSLYNPDPSDYLNVSFTFNNSVVYTAVSATASDILNGISDAIGNNYSCILSGTDLIISNVSSMGTVPDFSISFDTSYSVTEPVTESVNVTITLKDTSTYSKTVSVNYADMQSVDSVTVYTYTTRYDYAATVRFNASKNISQDIAGANGFGQFSAAEVYYYPTNQKVTFSSSGLVVDTNAKTISYTLEKDSFATGNVTDVYAYSKIDITRNSSTLVTHSYTYPSVTSSTATNYYTLTSSLSDCFAHVEEGETILVKNDEDAQQLTGSYSTAGTYTLGPIKSNGKWRFYTLGNWVGNVTIQYSTDNKVTWTDYYKWSSQDSNDTPANINTSGSLIADDLVWFRVVSVVSSTGTKPLQVFFATDSFSVNSYYKILYKDSNSSVVVSCVKNDVGTFSNEYRWRFPAFSNYAGWPQTIAFYQNRLFFGKGYIIYGSRSNDFWDFYEPVSLQADDPLTMSLLSQKVNNIKNLVTQRSFFTFTGGGEFGIGSEGALTQSDKYLKPFSSNGSAQCAPVLISDVVLFVDKSFNTVRALKYSLEADGYEAPDITITLKSLLASEKFISTDIIYEEKEALFLSDNGIIWCLKYITDQNVLSWSHWRHAFGRITNMSVVPNGPTHDLYIAVEADGKKWIEKLTKDEFMDTIEYFDATQADKVSVTGLYGDVKVIFQGTKCYFRTIDENGQIDTPDDHTADFKVGSIYTSTATLLSPTVQASDYSHNNYETKNPFKVFFYYLNSHGFKVGVEEDEKMEIEWQPVPSDIDDEKDLTSGKKSVLIPSRFDGSARVSFVQEEPYPMEVADVLIQTDYGGK